MPIASDLVVAVRQLRDSMGELESRSKQAALADQQWRLARAQAHAKTEGTVAERESQVERETSELRYKAKLADDLRVSALEAVRSNRTIVSAFQSLVGLNRAEAELARYESRETEVA